MKLPCGHSPIRSLSLVLTGLLFLFFAVSAAPPPPPTLTVKPVTKTFEPSPTCVHENVIAKFMISFDNPDLHKEAIQKGIEKQTLTITFGEEGDGKINSITLETVNEEFITFRKPGTQKGLTLKLGPDNKGVITGGDGSPVIAMVNVTGEFSKGGEKKITLKVEILPRTAKTPATGEGFVKGEIAKHKIKVELVIHNGLEGNSGGQEIKGVDKLDKGALTVANMNNTNGDKDDKGVDKADKDENKVVADGTKGRDEIDLMKLIVQNPAPDMKGEVTLRIVSGDVKLWEKSTKETEITVDKKMMEVKFKTNGAMPKSLPKTLWVEARSPSAKVQDIQLELEYMGCKDRVTATAIWARLNAIKNKPAKIGDPKIGDKNFKAEDNMLFADVNEPVLVDLITKKAIAADGSLFGIGTFFRLNVGTEKKPIFVDTLIGGRILFEWEVLPHGVESKGALFDVTRQAFGRLTLINEGKATTPVIDQRKFPEEELPPKDNETPNDDEKDTDEQNTPKNHHIYSYDLPVLQITALEDFAIFQATFREWIRLRLSPENPKRNFINRNGTVEGSRCSDKEDWHFIMYLRSNEKEEFEPDRAPTSFSAPVRVGKGNGTATVTLGANAKTEGFTAVFDVNQKWTLTGTGGDGPVSAILAGTTWTLDIPNVVKVVITQGAVPFVKNDTFKFSVFKTAAAAGKKFEIERGPINPLEGP